MLKMERPSLDYKINDCDDWDNRDCECMVQDLEVMIGQFKGMKRY